MRVRLAIFFIITTLLLNACSLGQKATPTAAATSTTVPAATLPPTAASPLAILVLPADMDKATSDGYQSTVYNLTQASGMRFQVRNSLSPQELEPGLQIVVALPPDPGIAALAAAAPRVQFLAIGIPGISAAGNVSVLGAGSQVDIPAFVAGYAAAMISNDHHAGMLLPAGDADAQRAKVAYANGMSYFCGLCQPFYYVPYGFPQFEEIPADEVPGRYPAYANLLVDQFKIDTVYLYPSIAIKELTDALTSRGTSMIGTALPNPKPGTWAMTIRPDEQKAIAAAWPALLAGQGGQTVPSPLGLADIDPTTITPGKQRLIQQVLDDLLAGRIATGVGQ